MLRLNLKYLIMLRLALTLWMLVTLKINFEIGSIINDLKTRLGDWWDLHGPFWLMDSSV